MTRTVVWFSSGAASAVAAKIAVTSRDNVHLVYIDTGAEHPDNTRFTADVAAWCDAPIETLKSDRYDDTWQVWEKRRYLNGPTGALCTAELKKRPRFAYQHPDDVQAFGYTAEEAKRADRFSEQNPGVDLWTPLIERGLGKTDCLTIIERAGIELPVMYRLGYRNNNCIGCVKGGLGYWNKIRVDFPDVFDRMARLERDIGATCSRDDDGAVWLDELDPDRGNYKAEPSGDCSLLCAITEEEIA